MSAGGGGGGTSGDGGAGGGDSILDIPCNNKLGCIEGDAQLTFHCKAPNDGSGVTSWDASFSAQTPAQGGACLFHPTAGVLQLSFPDMNLVWAFSGGESSHLANAPDMQTALAISAHGYRGDPAGMTLAGTSPSCSPGCEIDVLPKGRPLGAPGEWVTYRFVVTCQEPLGLPTNQGCGKCQMDPESFSVDAACYFPPAGG